MLIALLNAGIDCLLISLIFLLRRSKPLPVTAKAPDSPRTRLMSLAISVVESPVLSLIKAKNLIKPKDLIAASPDAKPKSVKNSVISLVGLINLIKIPRICV